ncbi:MAG: helix-turn-helix domain-containing protein [Myxococcota bacterium]
MMSLDLLSAEELALEVARRVRALRLDRAWTQVEAAARSGMTLASYKRFERTGEIAFRSLLKVAIALDQVDALQRWFAPPPFASLDQALAQPKVRKRAPRRRLS